MHTQQFQHELSQHTNPVIVDFWAAWCGPCKMISPILHKLAQEYQGRVDLLEVDADQSAELLRSLNIMAIPTLVVYQSGQEVLRQTGARSEAGYRQMFEQLATGEAPTAAGMSTFDRVFRLLAGAFVAWAGFQVGQWAVVLLGGAVMFWGIHDRCPIWRALTSWWKGRKSQTA